tara:strand:- start:1577 stop:2221 length:645 start_codon:yes stop_codon:yes gene_type:complete
MDEEITIIDTKTRNEKIKNFFLENKKLLISIIFILTFGIIIFYSYKIFKNQQREDLSNRYNAAVIEFNKGNKSMTISMMREIIDNKDSTYSPLALFYVIDNDLITDKNEINNLFNIIITKTSIETEIKNLIIYKKALFNADSVDENELLKILKPLMNTQSIWNSHSLYLIAEYFYSKNEKQKSKEFFNKIISLENANEYILRESQKRLNRDLSE